MKVYLIIREEWYRDNGECNDLYTDVKGVFLDRGKAKEAVSELTAKDGYEKKDAYVYEGVSYKVEEYETDKIKEE